MKKLNEKELARRIALDFNKTKEDIINELRIYCPVITDELLDTWEKSGYLEYEIIDGKKMYFKEAARNFLRLSLTSRALREELEGKERAGRAYILAHHIPKVISEVKLQLRSVHRMFSGLPVTSVVPTDMEELYEQSMPMADEKSVKEMTYLVEPHEWIFHSRIEVDADAVPDGAEIQCWMPQPRTDMLRQGFEDMHTVKTNGVHSAFFTCKNAEAGKPTAISNHVRFISHAEYHPLRKHMSHRAVDADCEELKPYLLEQAPHVVFTEELKEMAANIVGNETRPYYKARAIFEAMRANYPWIYAREYSTIDNIPEYVLKHKGGDCGEITMLFITLCRIAGVPARWQSGFILIPGYENYHDWAEVYIPGMGWIPVDPSMGVQEWGKTEEERYFYFGGIDAYRMIVNNGWGGELYPKKKYERSEPVDFQRGEVEWAEGNLYFDKWKFKFWVEPVL